MAQEETAVGKCLARVQFNLRAQADEDAEKICNLVQGTPLVVLENGEEWCKVRTENGAHTGYAKTSWLKYMELYTPAPVQPEPTPSVGAELATSSDLATATNLTSTVDLGGTDLLSLSGHWGVGNRRSALYLHDPGAL